MKLLQFKINYWTVEITCRIAVLIKYLSNQKNGGFGGFMWILEHYRGRRIGQMMALWTFSFPRVSHYNSGLLLMSPTCEPNGISAFSHIPHVTE